LSEKKDIPSTKIVVHSASRLTTKFNTPNEEIKKEGELTRKKLKSDSSYTSDGKVWINKKTLPHLLATDTKAANMIYNDLEKDDKFENGKTKNISMEAVQKEVSKRSQEPRDTLQRERLKDSELCLIALRDAPELEKIRELQESKIRRELPKVKAKRIKLESVDAITKEPLKNPEVHHKDRVADKPRKALDSDNLAVVNKETHRDIHRNNHDTAEEFKKLVKKNQ